MLSLLIPSAAPAQYFLSPDMQARAGSVLFEEPGWSAYAGSPSPLDTLEGLHAGIAYRRSYLLPELSERMAGMAVALPGRTVLCAGLGQKGFNLFRRSRLALGMSRAFGRSLGLRLLAEQESLRFGEGYGSSRRLRIRSSFFLRLHPRVEIGTELLLPVTGSMHSADEAGRAGVRYRCSRVFELSAEGAATSGGLTVRAAFRYQPSPRIGISGGIQSKPLSAGFGCTLRTGLFAIRLAAGHQLLPGWSPAAGISTSFKKP